MGRVKKSTRKFENKHLKRTLDDRKAHKKTKQQFILREKKKKQRLAAKGGHEESDTEKNGAKKTKESMKLNKDDGGPKLFEDMSVDQFFSGGFEVPEPVGGNLKGGKRKRERGDGDSGKEKVFDKKDAADGSDEEEEEEEDDENEFARHKGDIGDLADKDPEFYKYLQENDPELLDFSMAEKDDLSSIDELSEEDGGDAERTGKKHKKGGKEESGRVEVTLADVKKWKAALVDQKSLRCLRQVVLAFRAAAHVNDVEVNSNQGEYKYSVTNPDVYHELVVLVLKQAPEVLQHHIPIKESASGRVRVSTEMKQFQTLSPLLKSHSQSMMYLLPLLTDSATQKLLLNSTLALVPYFLSFRKFLKTFLKTIIEVWSTSLDEATRITAFLVVRKAAVIGDDGIKEGCLKALYAGFVKASRQTSAHTIQGINMMKNSAAEVFGLQGMDKVGYQTGFGYIRQLAVHLRNSITNNSKESYKTVYNWQYVHSLDFWSRVLAMHCDGLAEAQAGKESLLRPLIYPLVQVTLGTIRLIPTASYFPLRFFLTRSLLRLSMSTGAYIPLAPIIFEVLASTEVKKKAKPSTLKPLDFYASIRAPKSYLKTRVYQDGLAEQVVELLSEFYVLYAKSLAFPELAIPAIVILKRFIKKSKNAKFNSALHLFVAKLDANSKFVLQKRAAVDFAPGMKDGAEHGFMKEVEWEYTPLGDYVVSQRKVREMKRRLLEESLKDVKMRDGMEIDGDGGYDMNGGGDGVGSGKEEDDELNDSDGDDE